MVWVFQRLLLGFILIVVASGVLFFSTLDSVEPVAREYLGQPGSGSHRGIQALWISGDNTVALAFDGIVKVAIDRRLPLIVNDQEFDQREVLAAVGIGWEQSCKRAAAYVARVLGGERTATMPCGRRGFPYSVFKAVRPAMVPFLHLHGITSIPGGRPDWWRRGLCGEKIRRPYPFVSTTRTN